MLEKKESRLVMFIIMIQDFGPFTGVSGELLAAPDGTSLPQIYPETVYGNRVTSMGEGKCGAVGI